LQLDRVAQKPLRAFGGAALRAPAAQRHLGLGRDAEVAHHRDPGADYRCRARRRGAGALELDHVGAGLLHEAMRRLHGLLIGDLVRAEREVADQQRRVQPAANGRCKTKNLTH
jgi:hypothetical protein